MRLQSVFLLIPAIVGFLGLLFYMVHAPKSDFFRKQKRFITVLSCFFLFASLSSDLEARMMLHFALFEQTCALALVPCFLSMVNEYDSEKNSGVLFKLCCMIPMIHLVVGIESVYVAGFDESVKIFLESISFSGPMFPYLDNNGQMVVYACYTYIFKTFMLINFLMFAIRMMKHVVGGNFKIKEIFSYMFKGGQANLNHVLYFLELIFFLISIPALVIGKGCYEGIPVTTLLACLVQSYIICMISITGLGGRVEYQSIGGIIRLVKSKSFKD
jgi:hypothetical protein